MKRDFFKSKISLKETGRCSVIISIQLELKLVPQSIQAQRHVIFAKNLCDCARNATTENNSLFNIRYFKITIQAIPDILKQSQF